MGCEHGGSRVLSSASYSPQPNWQAMDSYTRTIKSRDRWMPGVYGVDNHHKIWRYRGMLSLRI